MGLLPLEFSDCLLDSPYFRENLRAHEKQLDQCTTEIKNIISNIQDVLEAARQLSKAKRTLASSLDNFQFDCIGTSLTDDEVIIANSVKQFAAFLTQVNDELDRLLDHSNDKFIAPLANFRKEQIGSVRKTKKDFDKATARFCSAQDRYISLSSKKEESLAEAAEAVRFERRNLNESSLEYVYLMHVVQEKKKFEFVEALLSFMRSWANYYRHGQAITQDSAAYMNDLQARVQKTRDNFSAVSEQYESLKQKMLTGNQDPGLFNKMYTRQGYLYVQNKKNIIGSQWIKHYCQYQAKTQTLTMIPYNQLAGKITTTESIKVTSCVCKEEAAEKFRFIVTGEDTTCQGNMLTHTLQAMSDYERKHWVEAMGGTWPAMSTLQRIRADSVEDNLNSLAFSFLKDCLAELENRGLTDQGLYRVGGVLSKVKKLLNRGLDPQPGDGPLELSDPKQWESKTIASAVKQYFRDLSKPLLTHHLYPEFVQAVKHESEVARLQELQRVVRKLPVASREILKVLIRHLHRVALKADENLMTAANIGVCFGPTLLRPREETVATIMDIKFCNEVVQILIDNCDIFFPPMASSSSESSPEVIRLADVVDGSIGSTGSREQRGSSTPKRTHSFSSFSQLSTNSLPDIKELKESKLSIAGSSTVSSGMGTSSMATSGGSMINSGRATTERVRSRSIQHQPIIISGPTTIAVRPKNLFKSSTQDDLMASLEFMNSLAADLPGGGSGSSSSHNNNSISINKSTSGPLWLPLTSPLKRSHTVQARRVVKIGGSNNNSNIINNNNSVKVTSTMQLPLQQQQQLQQQQNSSEVMRKPPLPKLLLVSPTTPTSSSSSFSVSVPVQQQQQQPQQHFPSHYVVVPDNVGGVNYYRNTKSFTSNLTPTVKAILSPTACEQPHWPSQHQQPQMQHSNQNNNVSYQQISSPKPSRPTDIYVREISLSDTKNGGHRIHVEPEPPIPPRSSSEGPSCSDTPPPLPARKFRRAHTSADVAPKQHQQHYQQEDLYSRPDKPVDPVRKFSSVTTTQTSPMLYRAALSIDSGVMMGSPSPPTDSGIGVSPPTQVRQHVVQHQQPQQQHPKLKKISSVTISHTPDEEEDPELTRFGEDASNLRRCRRRRVTSSEDSASLCSSALSVESDTSGSRYDNVQREKQTTAATTKPVLVTTPEASSPTKTSSLVAAAAEIAAASYLTASSASPATNLSGTPQSRDEDGDDEAGDSSSGSDDHLDLDSYSSSHSDDEDEDVSSSGCSDHEDSPKQIGVVKQRLSGTYDNPQPVEKRKTSGGSLTSQASSPEVTQKVAPSRRPELPPREYNVTSSTLRQHERRRLSGASADNPSHDAPLMHQLLAAGQTSNV